MKKHNALIVLKYLLEGNEIKIDDEIWMYHEGRIGVVRTQELIESGKVIETNEVHCRVSYPLDVFIKDCEKLSDDQIALICANKALNSFNKRKELKESFQ